MIAGFITSIHELLGGVSDYWIHLMILVGIYLILAQSFNINFGLGRLFNLAHVASYAIGAYTTALLSTTPGIEASFLVCMPASMLLAGAFAFLIGAISLKLSADYFAIGTLAFSSVVSALLINWKSLTKGVLGIPGIPRPQLTAFGAPAGGMESVLQPAVLIDFNDNREFLALLSIAVVLTMVILYVIFRSPYARSLRAQAEFELAAQGLAKNTVLHRNLSFLIASSFAGLAGSFFAYYMNYIDPSSFSLSEMVFVLTIVVVGRPGSFWGCIAAAVFLVLLPEPLRFTPMPPSILGPLRQLLYAVILFTVVFFNRRRLFPLERRV